LLGDRSTVPDIAVLLWEKIEFDANGEPIDNVIVAPDWTIEILSPEQSANRVMGNILHCLRHGCQLGWLIDPEDRSILIFRSQQQPELLVGENILPVLTGVDLTLTVAQVFSWLQMGG
jgi:Uma2 family endonuclease